MSEQNLRAEDTIIDTDRAAPVFWRARVQEFIGARQAQLNLSLDIVAALIWSLLGFRAITWLDTSWDSLAYHLPFAARLWGIFPKSSYLFYSHLEPLFDGQPKLAEFLQGMLWRLTGMVSAANLVGFSSLLLLTWLTAKRLRVPFWMVTLFFLSIPLVLIHSVTSMTDLPPNSFIGIAFVNLISTFDDQHFDNRRLFFILLPLGIAANMKFQALLITAPMWILVVLIFAYKNWRMFTTDIQTPRWKIVSRFLLVALVGGLLLSTSYIANLVRYQNPLYPLAVKIGPLSLKGPGYGVFSEENPSATKQIRLDVFKRYVASLSEVPLWRLRSGGPVWTVDMGVAWGAKAKKTAFFKTGGFFVANLVLWSVFLLISAIYARSRKYLPWIAFVACNFLFVSLLPSSYLLRYWMFLPVELAILTLWVYRHNPVQLKAIFAMVLILQAGIFCFVAYKVRNATFPPPSYTIQNLGRAVVNLDSIIRPYQLAGQTSSLICIAGGDTRMGFLYKLSNPQVAIQAAGDDSQCKSTTIIHP